MKMMMFCQPNDIRFCGRNVWILPSEIVTIESANIHGETLITLKDGRAFTLLGNRDEIAAQVNKAIKDA